MIPNFWLDVFIVIAGIVLLALIVLDWLASREARRQELREEARRHAHLDAIVRGRDGLR
jgi:hypothetical protein